MTRGSRHGDSAYNPRRSEEVRCAVTPVPLVITVTASNSSSRLAFPRWPRPWGASRVLIERKRNEHRYREVVQRLEGLRLHQARRRRRGPLRPFLRDPGQRLQDPEGEPEGGVRDQGRPQGQAGGRDQADRLIV